MPRPGRSSLFDERTVKPWGTSEMQNEFTLAPELEAAWSQAQQAGPDQANAYYIANVLPLVLEHLEGLEEHREIRRQHEGATLISLMGFSPETTVIATALLRPKRLIIIRSRGEKTSRGLDSAADYLITHGVIPFARIRHEEVDPTNPAEIYQLIQQSIPRKNEPALVDVTGGKKVMSATAAQAAWELNVRLCYIESESYDRIRRRPLPGTERLLVLGNPSRQRAMQLRRQAFDHYSARAFSLAAGDFRAARDQNEDNRLDDLAVRLCACYSAWMDLNLAKLAADLDELELCLRTDRMRKLLEGRRPLTPHIEALRSVSRGDKLFLIASFLELQNVYQAQGRNDFACLLAYRCMEALVEYRLSELARGEFTGTAPKYELLGNAAELEASYIALSREVDGADNAETHLPRKLGLSNGFAMLCILDDMHEKAFRGASRADAIRRLRGVAKRRNQSVLAHGQQTLTADDSAKLQEMALALTNAIGGPAFASFETARGNLRPYELNALENAARDTRAST
jgi:hypothetical protein